MKAEVLLDLLSSKPVTRREIRQQTGREVSEEHLKELMEK